jgi:hypothetical protein
MFKNDIDQVLDSVLVDSKMSQRFFIRRLIIFCLFFYPLSGSSDSPSGVAVGTYCSNYKNI